MPNFRKRNSKEPKAIIFDIDGVVCDSSERFKRIKWEFATEFNKTQSLESLKKYINSIKDYNRDCDGDELIEFGRDLLYNFIQKYDNTTVFFITARGISAFDNTFNWLKKHGLIDTEDKLYMYPENFESKDYKPVGAKEHAQWKADIVKQLMKQYQIVCAVDDSKDNCDAYKELGVPVLHFYYPLEGSVLV